MTFAVTIDEAPESRDHTHGQRQTRKWTVFATDFVGHEGEMWDAIIAAVPTTADDDAALQLDPKSIHLTPRPGAVDTVTQVGRWDLEASYVAPEVKPYSPPVTGSSSFSFDTSGGTQHITHALSHVHSYAPAGETAPDYKGAIGVSENGVEGCDITVPVYAFSETHYLSDATVQAHKAAYFSLTGKTNSAAFKGCAIGECLFLGARGSKRSGGDWEITFSFAASPNKTDLTVGGITGIAKGGWDYLWVRYDDTVDSAAKKLVKEPIAVYVERVYDSGDLGGLGIGT